MKKSIVSMTAAAALSLSLLSVSASAQTMPPVGWAPDGSPVAKYGQLKVSGTKVQSEKTNGEAQLRGMSFGWTSDISDYMKPGDFYNERVVAWLAYDFGVSLVRAAMGVSDKDGPHQAPGLPYKQNPATHKRYVTELVNAAIWQGIYVIIDWHSHHAHSESAEAQAFFKEMAQMYKDYPNVIYEIYNEPISANWGQIKDYANGVVSAIRQHDTKNLIIVGTPSYSSKINDVTSAVSGTNIVYAVHFYCNHSVGEVPHTSSTYPVFVSEFGLSNYDGNGTCNDNFQSVKSRLDDLDSKNISWANWQVNARNESSAILNSVCQSVNNGQCVGPNATKYESLKKGNWSTSDLSTTGQWIRTRLRGYSDYAIERKYKIDVTVEGNGTVSGNANIAPYASATVTATAGSGQRFEGWILNGVPITDNPYSISEVIYNRVGKVVFFADNLIKNSTFTGGTGNWAKYTITGADPGVSVVNEELVVTMPSADKIGTEPHEIRVQTTGLSLTNGRKYKITFDAKSTQAGRTVQLAYRLTGSTPSNHKFNIGTPVSLTTTMSPYEREFDMHEATTTTGVIGFYLGGQSGGLVLDNVKLDDVGSADPPTSVLPGAVSVRRASWSVSRVGGALQLRGPVEAGARVSLYDVRGKVVRSMAAADGLTLGAGVPAGSYIMVVKNGAGREVLRTRVVTAR